MYIVIGMNIIKAGIFINPMLKGKLVFINIPVKKNPIHPNIEIKKPISLSTSRAQHRLWSRLRAQQFEFGKKNDAGASRRLRRQ